MWLHQKHYSFSLVTGENIVLTQKDLESIVLSNGNETSFKLKDLFVDVSVNSRALSGYSILEFAELLKGASFFKFSDDENKYFTTFKNDSGQEFFLSNRKTPIIQLNDEEIKQDTYDKIIGEILIKGVAEKQEVAETSVATTEETPPVAIELHENEDYENEKKEFIESEYKEYKKDNYRLLLHEKKPAVLVELGKNGFERITLRPTKVEDCFSFKKDDKILIVQMENEVINIE